MNRLVFTSILLVLLAACQGEPVVRRSSIADQFSQMNKQGWAVNDNSSPKRAGPGQDPNMRVVREADFTGFHFNTNFQVDDPRIREQLQRQNGQAPQADPGPLPAGPTSGGLWGAAPTVQGSR